MATELLADAFQNRFDTAIIISGDSDMAVPLRSVKEHKPEKKVAIAFPPDRDETIELKRNSDYYFTLLEEVLINSQLNRAFKFENVEIEKPIAWK